MPYRFNDKQRQQGSAEFSDRQQRIYDFLHANPIGVLCSVDPNGDPHGAVIYYTIDKQFVVSFLTKAETRKYDNLKHHNHVMLTVFEPKPKPNCIWSHPKQRWSL